MRLKEAVQSLLVDEPYVTKTAGMSTVFKDILHLSLFGGLCLRGCVRDFQADFTTGVKHYVAFLRNFYVVL